tara:strand:+ start:742 stop:975 length:234 start_codon:yes stop_codon:yes gene_type:complete
VSSGVLSDQDISWVQLFGHAIGNFNLGDSFQVHNLLKTGGGEVMGFRRGRALIQPVWAFSDVFYDLRELINGHVSKT